MVAVPTGSADVAKIVKYCHTQGVLLTTKAGTTETACMTRLQAGHDGRVTLLRYDGQPLTPGLEALR